MPVDVIPEQVEEGELAKALRKILEERESEYPTVRHFFHEPDYHNHERYSPGPLQRLAQCTPARINMTGGWIDPFSVHSTSQPDNPFHRLATRSMAYRRESDPATAHRTGVHNIEIRMEVDSEEVARRIVQVVESFIRQTMAQPPVRQEEPILVELPGYSMELPIIIDEAALMYAREDE